MYDRVIEVFMCGYMVVVCSEVVMCGEGMRSRVVCYFYLYVVRCFVIVEILLFVLFCFYFF